MILYKGNKNKEMHYYVSLAIVALKVGVLVYI